MRLFLVPLTVQRWQEFLNWYEARKLPPPIPPKHAAFIADESERIVAGVCLYPSDGPFAVAEYFSVNPDAPPRLIAHAARLVCDALTVFGIISQKIVVTGPNSLGMAGILRRAGFREGSNVTTMLSPGAFALSDVEAFKLPKEEEPSKTPERATPEESFPKMTAVQKRKRRRSKR